MNNIPSFSTKKELFDYLIINKDLIFAEKKSNKHFTDNIFSAPIIPKGQTEITKKLAEDTDTEINRLIVGSTTYYMDSHRDVHIDGWAKKTIKENKNIFFRNQHREGIENILQWHIKPFTQTVTWRELGYNADGVTEALFAPIYLNKSNKNVPEYIWDGYKNYLINQHSVGMYYIKLALAINDDNYKEEFAEYQKHISKIVNKEEVGKEGYFWAVYEAKLDEISPVDKASHPITPLISDNNKSEDKSEIIIKTLQTLISKLEEVKPFSTLKFSETNKPLQSNTSQSPNAEELNKLYNLLINKL